MDYFRQSAAASRVDSATYDAGLRQYMLSVYNYMAIALAISGFVAFGAAQIPQLMQLMFGTPLRWVVALAPLFFVMFFSFKIGSMSQQTAQIMLWAFAAMMGLSMSAIFVVYNVHSIVRTFFVTAAVFGSMSLYGYTTKRNLMGFGSFLMMGLIGIVLASLVNLFMKSSALDFGISVIGVLLFVGLTAYDTQKIRLMYDQVAGSEMVGKTAIMGALSLYMDFINLFLMLLRFFGDRR